MKNLMPVLLIIGIAAVCVAFVAPKIQWPARTEPAVVLPSAPANILPESRPIPAPKPAGPIYYEGPWVILNRKLDGIMTAEVNDLGSNQWKGKFYGEWEGRRYSYNVEWSGPPSQLQGRAVIDRASYEWTGQISDSEFKGVFTGNRYNGNFNLKRK